MTLSTSYLCLILLYFCNSFAFSSHWNRVLPRICSDTVPDKTYNALMDCDQHMDGEAKNIFDDCVYEVTGAEISPNRPRICYYSKKGQQLDNCRSIRYKEKNFNIKQIISKELKHMWCLMKIARPLGWEHLCVSNLPQNKRVAVRRCDESFREITGPIFQCYGQLYGQRSDGRPIACRSFENPIELWQCLEKKTQQRSNANKGKDLESKAERYMDCLKNI